MKKLAPIATAIGLAAVLSIALVACGGGGGSSSSGSSEGEGGQTGGTMKASYASFPNFDPAISYTLEGWTAMYDTYIPLLTYAHADGAAGSEVVPGLAEALPEISEDGKTYKLTLRKGLEYSDGTPVKASDFAASIERLFRTDSPGSPYYEDIAGAEQFGKTKKGKISGIKTDDATGEITIELVKPRGTFTNELALIFAAVIPADSPDKDTTTNPVPATGPYEIVEVKPGKGWTFKRNPAWEKANGEAMPDIPAGYMEQIDVSVVRNATTQVNDVESGRSQWMQNPPPADRYASVKKKFEGTQFRVDPTLSTYFFWMNTKEAPFDDPKVRQAVSYAIDSRALERIYAGSLEASHQILPPGMPGSEELDLYPTDMEKAKELLAEAKPSDMKIGVWTDDESPNKEAGEYLDSVLKELGFETELKIPSADVYFEQIGNESTPEVDIGWADWFSDYPHPNAFFQPMLTKEGISPVNMTNLARYFDPAADEEIAELAEVPLGSEQEAAYAELDKEFMEAAPYVPYGTLTLPTFVSSEIDFEALVVNPTFGPDLTSFRFK